MRQKASIAIAALLAVAVVLNPTTLQIAAADVNGDAAVDVLDVQRVITGVLNVNPGVQQVDLNKDGALDVLDLQRLVGESSNSEEPVPTSKSPALGAFIASAPALTSSNVPMSRVETGGIPPSVLPLAASQPATDLPPPFQRSRYEFSLTPNAPPLA